MSKVTRIKAVIGAVLVLALILGLVIYNVDKYSENKHMKNWSEYMPVADDEAWLILENGIYEEKALLRGGEYYVKYELSKALFNDEFYYDEEKQQFFYSIPGEIKIITPDSKGYEIFNGSSQTLNYAPIIREKGEYYISLAFVSDLSEMKYQLYSNPARVVVNFQNADFLKYNLVQEAPLRFEASVKAEILMQLAEGSTVYYIGGTGASSKSFVSVMTADGIFGYVQKKYLSESYYEKQTLVAPKYEEVHILLDEPVKLGWHQISGKAGNDTYSLVTKNVGDMNVICPTWFRISATDGTVSTIGSEEYVKQAHEAGYKVWVLVDNFDDNVSTYQTLLHTDSRRALVDNLVRETLLLGADGINIDFEAISRDTGASFVQFIKELSIVAHEKNLVISVDNYVPSNYRAYYDLETQGKYADYIILMAYDEHYSGGEAGSVSSISYVTNAIDNCKKLVSDEQIVVGLPFYTRLWIINGDKTTSEALSMKAALSVVAENDVKLLWDEETAQHYGEYKLDGNTYKIWLEDADSFARKLSAVQAGKIGGIAVWRLGFETEEIWDLIDNYIK